MSDQSIILGFPVDVVSMDTAVARVQELIKGRRGQIVTANAEILYAARDNKELAAVINGADLVTADGIGVVIASRVVGQPVPERVTGVDLLSALAREGARAGQNWYLLGAAPGIAQKAGERLMQDFPGLNIVGVRDGYFAEEESPQVIAEIQNKAPDFLVVAMGLRQEFWVARHRSLLPCPAMGVGGALDVLAGKTTRAPQWMQRLGLEWTHRLIKEPHRFWRMLALPKFMGVVLWERLSGRRRS